MIFPSRHHHVLPRVGQARASFPGERVCTPLAFSLCLLRTGGFDCCPFSSPRPEFLPCLPSSLLFFHKPPASVSPGSGPVAGAGHERGYWPHPVLHGVAVRVEGGQLMHMGDIYFLQ